MGVHGGWMMRGGHTRHEQVLVVVERAEERHDEGVRGHSVAVARDRREDIFLGEDVLDLREPHDLALLQHLDRETPPTRYLRAAPTKTKRVSAVWEGQSIHAGWLSNW